MYHFWKIPTIKRLCIFNGCFVMLPAFNGKTKIHQWTNIPGVTIFIVRLANNGGSTKCLTWDTLGRRFKCWDDRRRKGEFKTKQADVTLAYIKLKLWLTLNDTYTYIGFHLYTTLPMLSGKRYKLRRMFLYILFRFMSGMKNEPLSVPSGIHTL